MKGFNSHADIWDNQPNRRSCGEEQEKAEIGCSVTYRLTLQQLHVFSYHIITTISLDLQGLGEKNPNWQLDSLATGTITKSFGAQTT